MSWSTYSYAQLQIQNYRLYELSTHFFFFFFWNLEHLFIHSFISYVLYLKIEHSTLALAPQIPANTIWTRQCCVVHENEVNGKMSSQQQLICICTTISAIWFYEMFIVKKKKKNISMYISKYSLFASFCQSNFFIWNCAPKIWSRFMPLA